VPTGTEIVEAHYIRVSGRGGQLPSLDTQQKELAAACAQAGHIMGTVYRDIGSGLSERRRGLTRALDCASQHRFQVLRVTHADRLSRFGVAYIQRSLDAYGVRLVVQHPNPSSGADELLADFMSLVASFAGRLYGQRSADNKRRLLTQTEQQITT
jgi:predicted site-specific integrase-resolvase